MARERAVECVLGHLPDLTRDALDQLGSVLQALGGNPHPPTAEVGHDTLTVAWARVVAHRALESKAASFDGFLEAHPQLRRRDLLSAYYSRELLFGAAARAAFVEPDLAPLP